MGKYRIDWDEYDNKSNLVITSNNIANELAEANRLKRLELDQHAIVRDWYGQIPSVKDLEDKA